MTIVLSGGGTGGHITPILAVAHELKRRAPDCRVVYIGEKGGKFDELTANSDVIDQVYAISAGKFRRYYKRGIRHTLTDPKTPLLNARDLVRFAVGIRESKRILCREKPDAVFLKGGFVGVPVGLAAKQLKIPFVTHDSDSTPGLANRLVGRWAAIHAVALESANYGYPASTTREVGVLVEPLFKKVSVAQQVEFKQELGKPTDAPLLLVTGGSTGAQRLNEGVVAIVGRLLAEYPTLQVIHQVGKGKHGVYDNYKHERLTVVEFMRPMYVYTGAADVVVARASANTVAELGVQGKPVIVVASPFLAGGHQAKNADRLQKLGAVLSVEETIESTDTDTLLTDIKLLLDDPSKREHLANALSAISKTDAAEQLATILLEQAGKSG